MYLCINIDNKKAIELTGEPKYKIGDVVIANGWVKDNGRIVDIQKTWHPRLNEWTWGYKIDFFGEGPGLTFTYIPEGYVSIDPNHIRDIKIEEILKN